MFINERVGNALLIRRHVDVDLRYDHPKQQNIEHKTDEHWPMAEVGSSASLEEKKKECSRDFGGSHFYRK